MNLYNPIIIGLNSFSLSRIYKNTPSLGYARGLFKNRSILWKRQAGQCKVCLANIDNGEKIEIHHLLPRKLGGKDNIDNLAMLHATCHKQVHSKLGKQTTGVSKLLEPLYWVTSPYGSEEGKGPRKPLARAIHRP